MKFGKSKVYKEFALKKNQSLEQNVANQNMGGQE